MIRSSTFPFLAAASLLAVAVAGSALAAAANVDQRPLKFGTTLPATCWAGDLFLNTTAPAGANLFACVATNTWVTQTVQSIAGDVSGSPSTTRVTQLQGRPLSATAPAAGQHLAWNAATNTWEPQTPASGATLAGDVVGPSTGVTVIQLQGRALSSTAPQNGQALVWNGSTSRWEPQVISSGASSGASMATQLGDLAVTRTGNNTLVIGSSCSIATPCNVRFGSVVYSIAAPMTVTLSNGTGNALIYVSSAGNIMVGHNLTLSCSSICTAQASVTAFPSDAIPLSNWHATNGAWDATGSDLRSMLASRNVSPGAGLITTDISGNTSIAADSSLIALRTTVPATSSTTCTAGVWAMDSNYYYVCATTNSWRRIALTTW